MFGENSTFNKDNFEGQITVDVTGEDYNNSVILNKDNNWSVTLTYLVLGKYSIKENAQSAKVSGYDLVVNYQNSEINLSETNLEDSIVITNIYTKTETYTEVSVEKVWEGNEENPEKVEIGLYKDGQLQEKQTLSKENNWTYKWTNLIDEYKWTVDEIEVPNTGDNSGPYMYLIVMIFGTIGFLFTAVKYRKKFN